MRPKIDSFSKPARRLRQEERGVALLTTLLLLMLMTGLSLAMVMSVRSDLLVNGYYRNFRGSFYAADSGLNIVRQALANQVTAAIPSTFAANTQPIPTGTESTILNNINSQYGSNTQINGPGSWPESFNIDTTQTQLSLVSCTLTGGSGTCLSPSGNPTAYTYTYNYQLVANGKAQSLEKATIVDRGNFTIVANVAASSSSSSVKTSFAAWGMFINSYNICDGTSLVPGTISGPVFSNGAWNFGTGGSYIFTDTVGSVSQKAGFQFRGTCDQVGGTQDTFKGVTIKPTFQNGFNLGQNSVPLPPNDYNQKRAVLDGQGTSNTQVTQTDLSNNLKDVTKTAYPASAPKQGVFLPYTLDASGNATFSGGGIYVEGDATVQLQPGSTSSAQVYTISQPSTNTITTVDNNGIPHQTIVPVVTTTTITTDPKAAGGGTTVVSQVVTTNGVAGSPTSVTINGVPAVRNPGTTPVPATMLYVNGNITSLSGPGQGLGAIQDGTALTITAAKDVTITGDILYKTPPVTMTQNQISNTPADTLIPGNDKGQVLGIFTSAGNINLNNSQTNPNNLEIDASLAAISNTPVSGKGGLTNIGSQINQLNIVGGRIQNTIMDINTANRNVLFDRRFASNGFAPPWFPSTTVTPTGTTPINSVSASSSFQRVSWYYMSASY
jgi:Tfp pilus assembly protein PilX